LRDRR